MCVIQGFLVRFIFLIDLFVHGEHVHGFSLVITAPFTIVHVLLQVVNTAYPVMEWQTAKTRHEQGSDFITCPVSYGSLDTREFRSA